MHYILVTLLFLAMWAPGPLAAILVKQSREKTPGPVENEEIFNHLFLDNHK